MESLVFDLEETFATIKGYDMKLNLEKYIIGLWQSWFLGYMVTEWGIEANPEKIEVVW